MAGRSCAKGLTCAKSCLDRCQSKLLAAVLAPKTNQDEQLACAPPHATASLPLYLVTCVTTHLYQVAISIEPLPWLRYASFLPLSLSFCRGALGPSC